MSEGRSSSIGGWKRKEISLALSLSYPPRSLSLEIEYSTDVCGPLRREVPSLWWREHLYSYEGANTGRAGPLLR
eukprot:scaffold149779_cov36-Tisochrysis_lutea.AAC.1